MCKPSCTGLLHLNKFGYWTGYVIRYHAQLRSCAAAQALSNRTGSGRFGFAATVS